MTYQLERGGSTVKGKQNMKTFKVHTKDSAPNGSQQTLEATEKAFGFTPNLIGVLAESPSAVSAYRELAGNIETKSSLSRTEQQIVLLTVSFENQCEYCVAAHTTIGQMQKIPNEVLEALRQGGPINDPKLEALRNFTSSIVRNRGLLSQDELNQFISAGYTQQAVLDVLVGVAMKTISNYTNHIAKTPLDSQFKANEWVAPTQIAKTA